MSMTPPASPEAAGSTPGPEAAGPAMGLVAWLHPGEHERARLLARFLGQSGIRHLRLGISWAEYYAPGGAEWFGWLLPFMAEKAELLPCVLYTPPSLGVVPSVAAPPRDPKAYADFLDVFTTRHGACFEWIELWNEPNNLNNWDWRLDPEWTAFCAMVGGAAYWMRQRGKRPVLGAPCPTDPTLLELFRANGVLDHVDAVSVHAFPETWTPHWQGWEAEIAPVREVLERCTRPPALWVTETGHSTWRHDEARQLALFAEAAAAPADRVYWYSLQDLDPELPSEEGFHFDERHYHCGVLKADGRPKLLGRMLEEGGVDAATGLARRLAAPSLRPAGLRPVLVTGGAGFLGCNIVDRLAGEGRQVLLLDNLGRPGVERNLDWLKERHGGRVSARVADLRDVHTVREAVRDASAVLHLAAQVAVTTSLADPVEDFEINARGTLNLLEAARACPEPPPLLFASTNKVYGKLFGGGGLEAGATRYQPREAALRRGCGEATPLDLYSPYGCSKGVADQYVLDYARVFGLRTLVFRMSCLYGPRQFGTEDQGWLAHFLIAALRGEPITIYGDGRQVRDALFVEDAVDAWLAGLAGIDRLSGRAFNLGGGPANTVSLLEMLALIERLAGLRPEVRFDAWRPGDQFWYVSDTSAFSEATGWKARTDIESGVRRLLDWLGTHMVPGGAVPLREEASA
ncbi:NAD-dependent epimerase/dehydratase family protein [Marinimicrococcus flavescens]|uniref:NAD-dependent epimerase/dehydratase family protein n=1 Tax=Marinimicrococcus flavescens TaxID=3031815 RepID=A0AAP3V049_9PROT|nr:NAD-dependent epimerase/dehydratase family protein [Marinimicrococcus flavescens]